jgi:hypothetical protein
VFRGGVSPENQGVRGRRKREYKVEWPRLAGAYTDFEART